MQNVHKVNKKQVYYVNKLIMLAHPAVKYLLTLYT